MYTRENAKDNIQHYIEMRKSNTQQLKFLFKENAEEVLLLKEKHVGMNVLQVKPIQFNYSWISPKTYTNTFILHSHDTLTYTHG